MEEMYELRRKVEACRGFTADEIVVLLRALNWRIRKQRQCDLTYIQGPSLAP
jgi:hypothetical protein